MPAASRVGLLADLRGVALRRPSRTSAASSSARRSIGAGAAAQAGVRRVLCSPPARCSASSSSASRSMTCCSRLGEAARQTRLLRRQLPEAGVDGRLVVAAAAHLRERGPRLRRAGAGDGRPPGQGRGPGWPPREPSGRAGSRAPAWPAPRAAPGSGPPHRGPGSPGRGPPGRGPSPAAGDACGFTAGITWVFAASGGRGRRGSLAGLPRSSRTVPGPAAWPPARPAPRSVSSFGSSSKMDRPSSLMWRHTFPGKRLVVGSSVAPRLAGSPAPRFPPGPVRPRGSG